MATDKGPRENRQNRCFLEMLLYVLAGSVLAAVSFSFLLWLKF